MSLAAWSSDEHGKVEHKRQWQREIATKAHGLILIQITTLPTTATAIVGHYNDTRWFVLSRRRRRHKFLTRAPSFTMHISSLKKIIVGLKHESRLAWLGAGGEAPHGKIPGDPDPRPLPKRAGPPQGQAKAISVLPP